MQPVVMGRPVDTADPLEEAAVDPLPVADTAEVADTAGLLQVARVVDSADLLQADSAAAVPGSVPPVASLLRAAR